MTEREIDKAKAFAAITGGVAAIAAAGAASAGYTHRGVNLAVEGRGRAAGIEGFRCVVDRGLVERKPVLMRVPAETSVSSSESSGIWLAEQFDLLAGVGAARLDTSRTASADRADWRPNTPAR